MKKDDVKDWEWEWAEVLLWSVQTLTSFNADVPFATQSAQFKDTVTTDWMTCFIS